MDRKFVEQDSDLLPVLRMATDEELRMLVDIMRKKLSCDLEENCRDIIAIANEFQLMGGSTVANITRGHGVLYREIVEDVADRLNVELSPADTISDREWKIVQHLFTKALEKMSEEEKENLMEELQIELRYDNNLKNVEDLLKVAESAALNDRVRDIIFEIVVGGVLTGLGIRVATGMVLGRLGGLILGPIGLVISALLVVLSLQGPAYSVTIPGVLVVGMIRRRLQQEEAEAVAEYLRNVDKEL